MSFFVPCLVGTDSLAAIAHTLEFPISDYFKGLLDSPIR